VEGDACDAEALDRLTAGAAACIHLIGIIREVRGESRELPQTFKRMHVQATAAALAACKRSGVARFLHMSALGASPDGVSVYSRTKWEAEQLVRRAALGEGEDRRSASPGGWTIFRPGLIHGPDGEFIRQVATLCSGEVAPWFFIPYFVRPVTDERVPVGPTNFVPATLAPVSVDDVAAAFCEALVRHDSIGEIYNLTGPETLNWQELMEFLRDALPATNKNLSTWFVPGHHAAAIALAAEKVGLGSLLPFDRGQALMAMRDSVADPTKAVKELGFAPRPFRETVRGYASAVAPGGSPAH
jgi:NADH dehydrogenase